MYVCMYQCMFSGSVLRTSDRALPHSICFCEEVCLSTFFALTFSFCLFFFNLPFFFSFSYMSLTLIAISWLDNLFVCFTISNALPCMPTFLWMFQCFCLHCIALRCICFSCHSIAILVLLVFSSRIHLP